MCFYALIAQYLSHYIPPCTVFSSHALHVLGIKLKSQNCSRLKRVTTALLNFDRNQDERQFGVQQEEAEKGKMILS